MLDEALVHQLEREVLEKWESLCKQGMRPTSEFEVDVTEYMNSGFLWDDISEILLDIGFYENDFSENENIRYVYCEVPE